MSYPRVLKRRDPCCELCGYGFNSRGKCQCRVPCDICRRWYEDHIYRRTPGGKRVLGCPTAFTEPPAGTVNKGGQPKGSKAWNSLEGE